MEVFRMIVWMVVAIVATQTEAGNNTSSFLDDIYPDVSYFQENPDAFLNNFGFMNLGASTQGPSPSTQKIHNVTCGRSSNEVETVWHSPNYPEETSLPSLCSLNLMPPLNTCAFRVTFNDLAFTPDFSGSDIVCPYSQPSFRMSHPNGISTSLCTNLTHFEGIMEVDPEDKGPFVLLLTLTSQTDFKFKITATAVSCGDINTYKSPNVCGIKNEGRRYQRASSIPSDLFHSQEGLQNDKFNVRQQPQARMMGKDAGRGEWPWMVVVNKTGFYRSNDFPSYIETIPCSGVLVDETHVLTTAACILIFTATYAVPASGLRVLVGEHDLTVSDEATVFNVSVSKVTFPLTYSPYIFKDDLAVLELAEPVTFNENVRPICLPVEYNVFKGDKGQVAGWGSDARQSGPVNSLQFAKVSLTDEATCNDTIHLLAALLPVSYIHNPNDFHVDLDDYVCAGSSVCLMDYGIPLTRKDRTGAYFLVGMAAQINSCISGFPNLFTKIVPNSTFLNLALV